MTHCASGSSAPWTFHARSKWFDYSRARDLMLERDRHKARALVHSAFG